MMRALGEEWPLVGRVRELRRLRDLLGGTPSRGAVLAGPPGVGKTRLAVECMHIAEQAGLAAVRVTATHSAAGLPLGALAPLLPPGHHGQGGHVDNRADLLHSSATALLARTEGRRLALIVDDAHLLDDVSATLVHQLAATDAASVVAALRTGDSCPDPILGLWKDELLERIELRGLGAEDLVDLLTATLDGPVDRGAAAHLLVRCQGNVLFLRELVLGALSDGTLRQDAGLWRLEGELSPSDRLIELIEARLAGLTPEERSLLELVSFGEPSGPAELNALGRGALAESLEERGLLSAQRSGRRLEVRLAHPLYGDVLRSRASVLRTRTVTRSLAEAVEATGARRHVDELRVATWRLDSGGGRAELMLTAATIARWRYDFPLAERLVRSAISSGAGFDAALLAAQLASLQGRAAQAEEGLADLAGQVTDDSQRALVAITRLDNYAFLWGRVEESLRVAEEAEAVIQDPVWRDEITSRRAGVLLGTQGPRAAAEAAEPLLERAQGRALAWTCIVASLSLCRLGRIDEAIEASARGRAAHLAVTSPLEWYPWLHTVFQSQALTQAGRLDEAERLADEEYQRGLAAHSVEAQAFFAWTLAQTALGRGRVETATRYGREAVALFRQLGRPQLEYVCLPYLAVALALGHRTEEATQIVEALDDLGFPLRFYGGIEPVHARAWAAVARGDLPEARRLLEEAVALGEKVGDQVGAAIALHDLARLGHAPAVVGHLEAVSATIDGPLARARVAHTAALARSDAAELAGASDVFETIGAVLLAAEAAADAAVAWRRMGKQREVTAAERRADSLVQRCQGARTPALQATAARAILTPAEREAVLLAIAGISNKEMAEKLFLSVRTVETRLQRAYTKLGVSGRSELAEVMEQGSGAEINRTP